MDSKALFYKLVSFSNAVHHVTNELTKNATTHAISQVQYSILEFVFVSNMVTPSEISDCLHTTMSNTSRELSKLYEKGLIIKTNDLQDKRRTLITLSPDGKKLMNEVFDIVEERFAKRIDNVSSEQLKTIEQAIDTLQSTVFYR
ncbi:MarR family winged helix-turn-helix transcriptional regulator [Paenibacillus yanchengensis]|uniref:MarR family winged helix-turn-helix transcriptional regulator n=1 Tax=Paenibacillus yanchengensis TaxID=2035833 RepID=A0ABW4YNA5_9BACL